MPLRKTVVSVQTLVLLEEMSPQTREDGRKELRVARAFPEEEVGKEDRKRRRETFMPIYWLWFVILKL